MRWKAKPLVPVTSNTNVASTATPTLPAAGAICKVAVDIVSVDLTRKGQIAACTRGGGAEAATACSWRLLMIAAATLCAVRHTGYTRSL